MPEAASAPDALVAAPATGDGESTTARPSPAIDILCVRCGYDQSGLLAPSAPAWPLESRCTECGCVIRWGHYFAREATQPRQWLEHAPWSSLWLALPRTLLVACTGWPLWRRLRMEHPIRWGRLALLLAVFCVGCAIWCVGTALSSAWSDLARMRRYAGSLALIVPSSNRSTGIDGYEATYEPATFGDAVEALLPVLTNPTSERPLTLMSYARVPTEEWTAAARAAVAEGVPTPPMQLTRQRYPVASTGWGPSAYWRGIPSGGAPWLPLTLTAASVSIASFIVLPIARRRAKVRAAHLTRASVYLAAACLPLLCLVAILSSSFRPSRPAVKSFLVGYDSDLITLLPMALVLGHWWYVAVKHYLRMERPWAVAASVTTLGILSGVVADLAAGV